MSAPARGRSLVGRSLLLAASLVSTRGLAVHCRQSGPCLCCSLTKDGPGITLSTASSSAKGSPTSRFPLRIDSSCRANASQGPTCSPSSPGEGGVAARFSSRSDRGDPPSPWQPTASPPPPGLPGPVVANKACRRPRIRSQQAPKFMRVRPRAAAPAQRQPTRLSSPVSSAWPPDASPRLSPGFSVRRTTSALTACRKFPRLPPQKTLAATGGLAVW